MMFDGLTDVEHLPAYVRSQPSEVRQRWIAIYETVFANTGDATRAMLASNVWLRSRLMKKLADEALAESIPEEPAKEVVASRSSRRILKFDVDTSKEFIKRSDSGEEYITAILQDVYGDNDGRMWPESLLWKFANQMNSGSVIIGDIDHEEWDEARASSITEEEFEKKLSKKKGIAKGVRATVEDGKLYAKILIDKRYTKLLKEKSKGLSIEAVVESDESGRVVDGKLLGFTFMLNENPANVRATIVG
jgi:hypothetical protein